MDTFFSKILTKPFLITVFRYALNAVGVWLAANANFDPGQWETISGAILVIAVTLMGASESTVDKAVVDGKSVDVSKLPVGVRDDLKVAVDNKKPRTLWDMFVGIGK